MGRVQVNPPNPNMTHLTRQMSKEDCVDSSFEVKDGDLNELNEEDDDVTEVGSESNAKVKKKTLKSKVWKFFDILPLGPDKKLRSKCKNVDKISLSRVHQSGPNRVAGHVQIGSVGGVKIQFYRVRGSCHIDPQPEQVSTLKRQIQFLTNRHRLLH
ncbi:hypothetical protein PanWU01x14_012980 [Parasponia andersonii]|uniref:Uncharacterized protein n=1 Tax=Parasponia andersonii TaxID=3476 RepID=A0A2P5E0Y3_PARAD|nr:hypothetical protein PanWU01x14_012980 [Parasponia andersonii]